MKDLVGVAAIVMIGCVLYVCSVFELPPGWEEVRREWREQCSADRGQPVIVNGKFVGCTRDGPSGSMYTPDGDWRDMDLVPMNWDWDKD